MITSWYSHETSADDHFLTSVWQAFWYLMITYANQAFLIKCAPICILCWNRNLNVCFWMFSLTGCAYENWCNPYILRLARSLWTLNFFTQIWLLDSSFFILKKKKKKKWKKKELSPVLTSSDSLWAFQFIPQVLELDGAVSRSSSTANREKHFFLSPALGTGILKQGRVCTLKESPQSRRHTATNAALTSIRISLNWDVHKNKSGHKVTDRSLQERRFY